MFFLFIIAILLIGANVATALITARTLDRLKKELAKQDQVKHEMRKQLEEAQNHKKTVEGSRDMLKRSKVRKQEEIEDLEQELKELEQEVVSEHEIATKELVEHKPVDSDGTLEEGGKSDGHEIKTRAPIR